MASGVATKIAQSVVKEVGKRLPRLAAKKAGSRIVGHITRNSRSWQKAFSHIKAHFKPDPTKPSHAVFIKKFQNEAALKELITQAASRPSTRPTITRLSIGGDNVGRPAVALEREFSTAIGSIGDKPCKILRIIVDFTGEPITAYPVARFLAAAGTATGISASVSASSLNALEIVAEVYAAERAEYEARINDACDPDSVAEWIIEFLISSSCIAPDPQQLISTSELELRTQSATERIASATGSNLDTQTKTNIRRDIAAIWGRGMIVP